MTRFFYPHRDPRRGWRIYYRENGGETDMCGAVDEAVARETCAILNAREVAFRA